MMNCKKKSKHRSAVLSRRPFNAFVVRRLCIIISLVSLYKILSIELDFPAILTGLCLTWPQIPKTGFLEMGPKKQSN